MRRERDGRGRVIRVAHGDGETDDCVFDGAGRGGKLERRWIVHRRHLDGEGADEGAVRRPAVIDDHGNDRGARGVGERREGQRAGGVAVVVSDDGIRDEVGPVGEGGDLDVARRFVGRAGGDSGERDGVETGVLVDGQVGDGLDEGMHV